MWTMTRKQRLISSETCYSPCGFIARSCRGAKSVSQAMSRELKDSMYMPHASCSSRACKSLHIFGVISWLRFCAQSGIAQTADCRQRAAASLLLTHTCLLCIHHKPQLIKGCELPPQQLSEEIEKEKHHGLSTVAAANSPNKSAARSKSNLSVTTSSPLTPSPTTEFGVRPPDIRRTHSRLSLQTHKPRIVGCLSQEVGATSPKNSVPTKSGR